MPSNKPLQRSGVDKVLGRGRGDAVLEQVLCARVLRPQWRAAERGRYTSRVVDASFSGARFTAGSSGRGS
jgi:hypothetical protein